MAPVVEGSSPFTHPNAPVAQLDRASDFESAGRPFEPDRARQMNSAGCSGKMFYQADQKFSDARRPKF